MQTSVSTPIWSDWPACPQCRQWRQGICPACGHAGVDFPLADYQSPAAPHRLTRTQGDAAPVDEKTPLLFLCPICDEASSLRYYRRCARCAHDFKEGVELPNFPPPVRSPVNRRMVFLAAAMTTVIVVLMAYFWWVLRQ